MSAVQDLAPAPIPHRRVALFKMLAGERKMVSGAQRDDVDDVAATGGFVFVDRTWVTLWYDPAHAVRSECGGMTAYRAITTTGDLLWYVAPEGEAPVFHAQCADPFQAIAHATVALGAQSDLNRRWTHIEQLARELRHGIIAFDVTHDDVRSTPMAPIGFKTVMACIARLGGRGISGRHAALLMKVEPGIGFSIHMAWMRAQIGPELPKKHAGSRRKPVDYEAIC